MNRQKQVLDAKDYLRELINHYTEHLENNSIPVEMLGELIKEERNKCIHKLHRIQEMDAEAFYLAKSGGSAFV